MFISVTQIMLPLIWSAVSDVSFYADFPFRLLSRSISLNTHVTNVSIRSAAQIKRTERLILDNDGCRGAEGRFRTPSLSSILPLGWLPLFEEHKSLWRLSARWWIGVCANAKRTSDKGIPPSSMSVYSTGRCARSSSKETLTPVSEVSWNLSGVLAEIQQGWSAAGFCYDGCST